MSRPKKSIIEYRNYFLPPNFPVLLLHGDYWKISDIPSCRLHFHNCLEIGVCHSDSGTIEILGQSLYFKEGDITNIPKNLPHTTYSTKGTESHWSYLFFDPQELFHNLLPTSWHNTDLSIFVSDSYKFILNKADYPHLYTLLMLIIRELTEQRPNYQMSAKGLLLSLYTEFYRIQIIESNALKSELSHSNEIKENSLMIAPVLDYIDRNYMYPFSIKLLSDFCRWSPTHFRRVFHEIMNMSPLDFVNNTRIIKSCNLLRSTEHTILDISEMVGFHSVSSYNRCFSKIMNMSPSEYRKQIIQSEKKAETSLIRKYAGWMFPE